MIAILLAAALSVPATGAEESWQRNIPIESCEAYYERLYANDYDLWRKYWCQRKRYATCVEETRRGNYPLAVHPYWVEKRSGCRCTGTEGVRYDVPAGFALRCPDEIIVPWPPVSVLIFESGFETGDTSEWSTTVG